MSINKTQNMVELETSQPIWDRFFMVAPLVLVGSREPNGEFDLAPKHMVAPLSWENYFGFVCTHLHSTFQNIKREQQFTVSFPNPDNVLLASLSASPRCEDYSKPSLQALPTVPASKVSGVLVANCYLHLECELDRIVEGFGKNCLIAGKIVAAQVEERALRMTDKDDAELLEKSPLMAYLPPGRYAAIHQSLSFPFPKGFTRDPEES
jgi:flavin reductase (DIM6/NTAB) family NADH-FMN oxidoreductase RutF